jgi:hypothetical protein
MIWGTMHPNIATKCRGLFDTGAYAEAVEKSFKVVRDRLRTLSGYETGAKAFGEGKLHIKGAAAAMSIRTSMKQSNFFSWQSTFQGREKPHIGREDRRSSIILLTFYNSHSLLRQQFRRRRWVAFPYTIDAFGMFTAHLKGNSSA